jgi:hypothetical protein
MVWKRGIKLTIPLLHLYFWVLSKKILTPKAKTFYSLFVVLKGKGFVDIQGKGWNLNLFLFPEHLRLETKMFPFPAEVNKLLPF